MQNKDRRHSPSKPGIKIKSHLPRPRGRPRAVTVGGVKYASISNALKSIDRALLDPRLLAYSLIAATKVICARIVSHHWTDDQAFGFAPAPPSAVLGYPREIDFEGKVYPSLTALSEVIGMPMAIFRQRIERDRWSVEAAANLVAPPNNRHLSRTTTGLIYMIRNKTSGRGYIGLTIDLKRRLANHMLAAFKKVPKTGSLHDAILKDGIDTFEVRILENYVPSTQLQSRERHWIKVMNTLAPEGFNENCGGVFGCFGEQLRIANEVFSGIADAARHYKIPKGRVYHRLQCGWTVEEALGAVQPSYLGNRFTILVENQPCQFSSRRRAANFFRIPARLITEQAKVSGNSWEDELQGEISDRAKRKFVIGKRKRSPNRQAVDIVDLEAGHAAVLSIGQAPCLNGGVVL